MLKSNVDLEDAPAVPEIRPELLKEIKKEDMKQAVVERFRIKIDPTSPRTAARHGARSPYWLSADEEC